MPMTPTTMHDGQIVIKQARLVEYQIAKNHLIKDPGCLLRIKSLNRLKSQDVLVLFQSTFQSVLTS